MIAAIGVTVGLIASAVVNSMSRKREEKIWKEVNENRRQINRIQTARKWRKYGGVFDTRTEPDEEVAI